MSEFNFILLSKKEQIGPKQRRSKTHWGPPE